MMSTFKLLKKDGLVPAFDAPKDEDGRNVYGDPEKGCRHCGHVAMKHAADGNAILYHPGVECCADAIKDQIRFRKGEIERVQAKVLEDEERVKLLTEEVDMLGRDSRTQQAHTARYLEEKALNGLAGKQFAYQEQISELSREVKRLEATLKAHS